eukprot:6007005-Amphidinium_carterae.1
MVEGISPDWCKRAGAHKWIANVVVKCVPAPLRTAGMLKIVSDFKDLSSRCSSATNEDGFADQDLLTTVRQLEAAAAALHDPDTAKQARRQWMNRGQPSSASVGAATAASTMGQPLSLSLVSLSSVCQRLRWAMLVRTGDGGVFP